MRKLFPPFNAHPPKPVSLEFGRIAMTYCSVTPPLVTSTPPTPSTDNIRGAPTPGEEPALCNVSLDRLSLNITEGDEILQSELLKPRQTPVLHKTTV